VRALHGGKITIGCSDDIDAVDVVSVVAGNGGTLHKPLLLSRSKVWDTIFMKSRYSVLTSQFDVTNSFWELNSVHWSRYKNTWPLISFPHNRIKGQISV
jgi:hypothetical protein